MDTDANGFEREQNGRFTVGNKVSVGRNPPKISTKVKQALVNFLELNIEKVQESFDQLKPLEKLQFIANILPYMVPKLSSIESDANVKHSGGINIRWSEPGLLHSNDKGGARIIQGVQGRLSDNSEPGGDTFGEDIHGDTAPDSPGA